MDLDLKQLVNLVVSASDPSGRRGLGLDLKTIHALGGQSSSVCTGILLEADDGKKRLWSLGEETIAEQMAYARSHLNLAAIKVGWLPGIEAIKGLAEALPPKGSVPLVLDLTLAPSPESDLRERMKRTLEKELVHRSSLVTLGCAEASEWSGGHINTPSAAERAAMELGSRWGVPVLVTGGDLDDDHDAMDVLLDGENSERFHGFRLQVDAVPGKGECLSTAIAAQLGWGATLAHAISEAKASIAQWILTPSSIGQGLRALCPSADPMELDSPHP